MHAIRTPVQSGNGGKPDGEGASGEGAKLV